ncbi:unnamed protein product [Onchocerca flexuosa]|uniref:Uncharacterized protein n=1 Tax=Onchocerca flexuosa TaxID=387005 RepID=A0A183H168_9BILA|nr:unnamed protein product [Onchocerca flexuosa]
MLQCFPTLPAKRDFLIRDYVKLTNEMGKKNYGKNRATTKRYHINFRIFLMGKRILPKRLRQHFCFSLHIRSGHKSSCYTTYFGEGDVKDSNNTNNVLGVTQQIFELISLPINLFACRNLEEKEKSGCLPHNNLVMVVIWQVSVNDEGHLWTDTGGT